MTLSEPNSCDKIRQRTCVDTTPAALNSLLKGIRIERRRWWFITTERWLTTYFYPQTKSSTIFDCSSQTTKSEG
jgi:hypothetical protein